MSSRGPNTRFADLFALTGWSKGELARLVNRQGAAMGHQQLSTDTSRVRRWIEHGETPRDPVPRVLAALFTERLGRVVTIEDLGFAATPAHRLRAAPRRRQPDEPPWEPGRRRGGPHRVHGNGPHAQPTRIDGRERRARRGRGIANALHDWLNSRTPRSCAAGTAPRRSDDPAAAPSPAGSTATRRARSARRRSRRWRRSVEVFRAWDAARGGGLQRKAVVGQLNEVGGMLTVPPPDTICSGGSGASPPTSRCWPAGCPTTSASNPPRRSTS